MLLAGCMDSKELDSGPGVNGIALPEHLASRFLAVIAMSAAVLFGAAIGLGCFTFYYAEGASYFSDNPTSCANCHVMQPKYGAWAKSSHHAVATCNDCHAPHDSIARKLYVKGVNGFRHSWAFTTGQFHEPIQITEFNHKVTEESCRYCHTELADSIDIAIAGHYGSEAVSCTRCHYDVGHR
jgi:cytochrome c nitrite reductase small subunit